MERSTWVSDANLPLFVDLYELTMLQAYWREGMHDDAVFSLYVRRLPPRRNYIVACGLHDALHYLESIRFDDDALEYLRKLDQFSDDFLGWLANYRFTGDVFAVPEGTPLFPEEPILEVRAPLPEAQIAETFIMNQVHFQTLAASKAARVVHAARGRTVVDFGMRRMHGADAGVKAARAFFIAGVQATSNVLAGRLYGIPVTGTMAHSYVQSHDEELDAFLEFARLYPETILLIDTYDTIAGARKVVELAKQLGNEFRVRGVRLDSGDLAGLAFQVRKILDEAGLSSVEIFASGGLGEDEIADIVDGGAPITGFGVGTKMGVSADEPCLDIAYKLTSYAGKGRLKLSPGKLILPGRKQVFRVEENGRAVRDIVARHDEEQLGRPLLEPVMRDGRRLAAGRASLDESRERARAWIEDLPDPIQALAPADPPYPVELSASLRSYLEEVSSHVAD